MNTQEILNAINLKLCDLKPDFKIYVKFQPQGFERPAFFCEHIRNMSPERLNKRVYKRRSIFQIIYFAPTDDYYSPDRLGLYDVADDILDAFSDGYIEVSDRAPYISADVSEITGKEAYITVSIEYTERTVGAQLEITDTENADKVEEIILNERGFKGDSSD